MFVNYVRISKYVYYCPKKYSNINQIITKYSTKTRSSNKLYGTCSEAISDVKQNDTLLIGGFALCGVPQSLLNALTNHKGDNYTIVSNNIGTHNKGIGTLLKAKKVKRIICSYIGNKSRFTKQFMSGDIELELVPQGTLAEKLRAGGSGIPAFYIRTGMGSLVQTGGFPLLYNKDNKIEKISEAKETEMFEGIEYLLEESITGDFALIKAWKADKAGNLIFRKSARNFNPTMAKAANITIAEVEEIVNVGELDPDQIHLPGIFVDRIVLHDIKDKLIENYSIKKSTKTRKGIHSFSTGFLTYEHRMRVAKRAVLEIKDDMYVNIGNGSISYAAYKLMPSSINALIFSWNGVIGLGEYPASIHDIDPDMISFNRKSATVNKGASFFSSDESFAMMRGGHIDLHLLSAQEVSECGDYANSINDQSKVMGMAGDMDASSSLVSRIVICMEHVGHNDSVNILQECSLPLSGQKCVKRIITDLCVFDVDPEDGLTLIEIADGVGVEDIIAQTGCSFVITENLIPMKQIRLY